MQLSGGRHFSYCLNVHPGEDFSDIIHALIHHVPEIKKKLSPDNPFGLGLRIAKAASVDLRDSAKLQELKDVIDAHDCYGFTINGFPFGAFHQTRVKEQVYEPDWSSAERLEYTKDLCTQLAFLLPDGVEGSVSTVPLGYKFSKTKADPKIYADHLNNLALFLHQLEQDTGKLLHLGLEPEPDCLLETTTETLAFFENDLFKNRKDTEDLLRRHIGVCVDTCHVAMQFENIPESMQQLSSAGIRISKTQISAALECEADIVPDKLKAFDDGVYLHQIKSETGSAWRDLPDYRNNPLTTQERIRIHAHVPLHWEGNRNLQSTRPTLTPDFWDALNVSDCKHLEVETYTFDVLPEDIRKGRSVAEDMIEECQWALAQLN